LQWILKEKTSGKGEKIFLASKGGKKGKDELPAGKGGIEKMKGLCGEEKKGCFSIASKWGRPIEEGA